MRRSVIGAAVLGAIGAGAPSAAAPLTVHDPAPPHAVHGEEGAGGGAGLTLAGVTGSSFLLPSDTRQSALVPVAEGGEGGEGGRGKARRRPHREFIDDRDYRRERRYRASPRYDYGYPDDRPRRRDDWDGWVPYRPYPFR